MKKINELNVDELRQLKNIVLQYSTLDELVTAIDFSLNAIYYQDVPLNVRFDLNMFKEDTEEIIPSNTIEDIYRYLIEYNFE